MSEEKFPKFLVEQYSYHHTMQDRINQLFASTPMYRAHLLSESRDGYTVVYVRVGELPKG